MWQGSFDCQTFVKAATAIRATIYAHRKKCRQGTQNVLAPPSGKHPVVSAMGEAAKKRAFLPVGEAGMVKRCENGEIGIFSLCQPLDISSVTGRCQHCWSHAKTQSQDKMFTFPALHPGAFAPLREVKSWNRQTLESRQSGMFSSSLPVSLSPFHHPRARLPPSRPCPPGIRGSCQTDVHAREGEAPAEPPLLLSISVFYCPASARRRW